MTPRLSTRIGRVAPSATLAVTDKARRLRAAGVDVVSFGAGEPDFDTPPHIRSAAERAIEAGDTKYVVPAAGRSELRSAICEYLRTHCGLEYAPDQIGATVGAKEALYEAFSVLLNPGDEVLIPAPYWVSYPDQVALADGVPVFLDTLATDCKLTADALRRAITPRTRALVLNSPCNPTGVVYSREEFAALADVLRNTDVLVISDEIYHRLVFNGETAVSFAALPGMLERTITVNGVSKSYAMTGWRLGFAAGPRWFAGALGRLQGQSNSGVAGFVQTAATVALTGDQTCVAEMRTAYARRAQLMLSGLRAIPGLRCLAPEGAFYCFARIDELYERLAVRDADAFAEAVLDRAAVAIVSGTPFGAPHHVRLSFATSDERIREGLSRLQALLG